MSMGLSLTLQVVGPILQPAAIPKIEIGQPQPLSLYIQRPLKNLLPKSFLLLLRIPTLIPTRWPRIPASILLINPLN